MCCHVSCPSNKGFARLDPGLWEMANCVLYLNWNTCQTFILKGSRRILWVLYSEEDQNTNFLIFILKRWWQTELTGYHRASPKSHNLVIKMWSSLKLMRVNESWWELNVRGSYSSHQLSSSFFRGFTLTGTYRVNLFLWDTSHNKYSNLF